MSTNIEDITLSEDQQKAMDDICSFVADPEQAVFVLSGYAGTGKSTLVSYIMDFLPNYIKTLQAFNPGFQPLETVLTATTNKACEALAQITGEEVCTIHSLLKLRLAYDARGNASLHDDKAQTVYRKLIFIDEASFIDRQVLGYIFEYTNDCKIIFMGDPAQLAPVKSADTPVFILNYPGAKLETVMRQAAGNPIIELATLFRHAVNTGEWPEDVGHLIDGTFIQHMNRVEFNEAVLSEFTRPDWKFADSKVLAWTNARGVQYNQYIREHAKGEPELQVDDYAIVNKYCTMDRMTLRTDQMVQITKIENGEDFGVEGKWYELDSKVSLFMPNSLADRKAAEKRAISEDNGKMIFAVNQNWVDLRAAYACTVNKSQGSTYGKAYVDLDDIGSCRNKNTLARMLYVGFSRARTNLILTGDLR